MKCSQSSKSKISSWLINHKLRYPSLIWSGGRRRLSGLLTDSLLVKLSKKERSIRWKSKQKKDGGCKIKWWISQLVVDQLTWNIEVWGHFTRTSFYHSKLLILLEEVFDADWFLMSLRSFLLQSTVVELYLQEKLNFFPDVKLPWIECRRCTKKRASIGCLAHKVLEFH